MTLSLHRPDDLPPALRGGVWCIGNFDGVHRGHQLMLQTGRQRATETSRPFCIMTFHPHPLTILAPERPLQFLSTNEQRRALLEQFQPDVLLTVEPTSAFLNLSPDDFLATILQRDLAASHIVEGQNFTYGKGAAGNTKSLIERGPTHGFVVTTVPTRDVTLADLTILSVSSSRVRTLLSLGRVEDAARCLGRPYSIIGTVEKGAQRGRTIGFPTINLRSPQLIPGPGVFAGIAKIDGASFAAAISIGNNPTFSATQTTVEAHLLNFSRGLYGSTVELSFHRWLRDMRTYGGIDPLVRQIKNDVAATADWYAANQAIEEMPS